MMSTQDQIARLQSLLQRVQKNASRPRTVAIAAPPPPPEELAPEPVEEELVAMDEAVVMPEPEALIEPAVVHAEQQEETSMVRAIEAPADDAEVSVEMSETSIEDIDLLEDEIVDITEASAEEPAAEAEEEEIEPPASSRRPIAGSMGEALAGAAELDEGREIPLKTPPPESGPQAAPPPHGLGAPPLPDLGELGETDIMSGTQPTAAQLGATVELEPAEEAELELGEPVAEAPPVHVVREEVPAPPPPPPPAEPVQPQVVQRAAIATAAPAAAFVSAAKGFQPQSFAELLDASLALGKG